MRIKSQLTLRHIGHHYMVVEMAEGVANLTNVYYMNETAAWLWNQFLDRDFTKKEMVEHLCEAYEVSKEKATEDVEALVNDFQRLGLVENDEV